jgi:hypothetical protein
MCYDGFLAVGDEVELARLAVAIPVSAAVGIVTVSAIVGIVAVSSAIIARAVLATRSVLC